MKRLASVVALAFVVVPALARADSTVNLAGDVPNDGKEHFFLPFTVPPGTQEIEVAHDDESAENVLDWGLYDPTGHRGWGGGNPEPTVVNDVAASRGYVPGPIAPGEWRVVVGKARISVPPGRYKITITLRDQKTLAAVPRAPYAPVAALRKGPAWFAGDFHTHSFESGDAKPPLADMVSLARSRRLDFIEVSDHNTTTQLDFFNAAKSADVLLVPGIEYTTYAGHANAIGATKWVDHKIGQPGVTIDAAADAIHAQGALVAQNHPTLDLGDLCIGCGWKHALADSKIDAVEVATGGWRQSGLLFSPTAQAQWDAICATGRHVAAIGGSDDHQAGEGKGARDSAIGSPTTMIYADELSVAGILEGIRRGRTVVKLQDPTDPMVEVVAAAPGGPDVMLGDTVEARGTTLRAKVLGAKAGDTVYWVKNGERGAGIELASADQTLTLAVRAPGTGEDRYRVEVWGGTAMRTVTGHVYVKYKDIGTDPTVITESSGCACNAAGDAPSLFAVFALLALLRRRSASAARTTPSASGSRCWRSRAVVR